MSKSCGCSVIGDRKWAPECILPKRPPLSTLPRKCRQSCLNHVVYITLLVYSVHSHRQGNSHKTDWDSSERYNPFVLDIRIVYFCPLGIFQTDMSQSEPLYSVNRIKFSFVLMVRVALITFNYSKHPHKHSCRILS